MLVDNSDKRILKCGCSLFFLSPSPTTSPGALHSSRWQRICGDLLLTLLCRLEFLEQNGSEVGRNEIIAEILLEIGIGIAQVLMCVEPVKSLILDISRRNIDSVIIWNIAGSQICLDATKPGVNDAWVPFAGVKWRL